MELNMPKKQTRVGFSVNEWGQGRDCVIVVIGVIGDGY